MTKKVRKNILRTKRAVKVKLKAFFITFKGLPVDRNYLGAESRALAEFLCHTVFISLILCSKEF